TQDYCEQVLNRFSRPPPLVIIVSVEHNIGVDIAVSGVTEADYCKVIFFGQPAYGPDELGNPGARNHNVFIYLTGPDPPQSRGNRPASLPKPVPVLIALRH